MVMAITVMAITVLDTNEDRVWSFMTVRKRLRYWNRRGENEIDIVAVNEIDHVADVFEVKRHKSRYDERLL